MLQGGAITEGVLKGAWDSDRQTCLDTGFDHHLLKPIDDPLVLAILDGVGELSPRVCPHRRKEFQPHPSASPASGACVVLGRRRPAHVLRAYPRTVSEKGDGSRIGSKDTVRDSPHAPKRAAGNLTAADRLGY